MQRVPSFPPDSANDALINQNDTSQAPGLQSSQSRSQTRREPRRAIQMDSDSQSEGDESDLEMEIPNLPPAREPPFPSIDLDGDASEEAQDTPGRAPLSQTPLPGTALRQCSPQFAPIPDSAMDAVIPRGAPMARVPFLHDCHSPVLEKSLSVISSWREFVEFCERAILRFNTGRQVPIESRLQFETGAVLGIETPTMRIEIARRFGELGVLVTSKTLPITSTCAHVWNWSLLFKNETIGSKMILTLGFPTIGARAPKTVLALEYDATRAFDLHPMDPRPMRLSLLEEEPYLRYEIQQERWSIEIVAMNLWIR